jgi:hypothetical protein
MVRPDLYALSIQDGRAGPACASIQQLVVAFIVARNENGWLLDLPQNLYANGKSSTCIAKIPYADYDVNIPGKRDESSSSSSGRIGVQSTEE